MKLLDDNGKLFGKINMIDFGIVLMVIVIAFAAYLKFGVLDQTGVSTELEPVRYTIELKNVRSEYLENIQIGDTIYDTGGTEIGTITNVSSTDYEKALEMLDGTIIIAAVPDRYTTLVEVEAETVIKDGRYLVYKTYELGTGVSRIFNTKYIQLSGSVKEIWLDEK